MDGDSYDVAKSCPVSCRVINQYGGTTCMPNFSRVNQDTTGCVRTGEFDLHTLRVNGGLKKHFLLPQVACHKLLIELRMKRQHLPKIMPRPLLRGDKFFSQSLSKHYVDWENDSAKWNLAFSFENTKKTGWPSVREIRVKELANPIFALFTRSCRGKMTRYCLQESGLEHYIVKTACKTLVL